LIRAVLGAPASRPLERTITGMGVFKMKQNAKRLFLKKDSRNKLPLVGKSGRAGFSTSSDMFALCKLRD
jgi:hypothetical protein